MSQNNIFETLDEVVVIEKEKVEDTEVKESKGKSKKKKAYKKKDSTQKIDKNTLDNKDKCKSVEDKACSIKDKDNVENRNKLSTINVSTIQINNDFINSVNKIVEDDKRRKKEEIASLDKSLPYIKNNLLTSAEKQLFHFMNQNLFLKERILIFPKVRLGDLVELDTRLENDMKAYYKVACKHVDYVIVDKDTLDIICVVELDDYTHDTEKAKQRDQFVYFVLQTVGINMFRVKSLIKDISKKDLSDIEDAIAYYYRPKCCWCGSETQVQHSNKFGYKHRFYSCTNYRVCRWTLDCD